MSVLSEADIANLQTWISREECVSDFASQDLASKLHATLNRSGPPPVRGEAMPPLAHFCLAQPVVPTDSLGVDGHPAKGGFLPPVPLPRRMWAGGRLQFQRPLLVGDEILRTSRIKDVQYKSGRSGALCFVIVEHRLESSGQVLLTEEQDIVYREAATALSTVTKEEPARRGEHQRSVTPSSAILFRYSALTFNGHRIHYDRQYAVEQEFYPGLVVHGPLQATLLANFAADLMGRPLAAF